MAVSFTTEQKLIFYLAQNIARLEPSFDAFKISRILVECGVFKENPLLVGERSKEATFVLLKHLFEMLSSRNDARAQQFRIFRLAVGEAGNREILEECLPDLGCSKDVRNNDVAKWLTPYTGSAEELVLFSLVVFVFLCFCVLSVKRAACGGMLQMIRIGKSWPRNTLNGVSDSSKTTLAKAALGCVGLEGADFNNCTKPVLQQMLAKTTMGFLVDDPKSITLVSEVAVEAFNRSTQGTLKHGFNVPRSSFMITSNSDLQGVAQRVLSRLIVLPFNERLAQSQQEAWQNIAVLLEKASAAIGFSLDTRLGFLRQSS
eukprot:m.266970 g.266970  ORF g.266970 m.266970 type:complete len:316 (+) comp40505_c0_seq58:698-1645(+)